jgi:hypothetical protein
VYFIERAMLVVFLILGIVPLSFASDTTKSVSESRLQSIAGNDAENCGHVHFGTDSKKADRCVRKSFAKKRGFYVRYDQRGRDSVVEHGLAGNRNGEVYFLFFDSLGYGLDTPKSDEQFLDDNHSVVKACPKPIHFRRDKTANSSGLTCLSRDSR